MQLLLNWRCAEQQLGCALAADGSGLWRVPGVSAAADSHLDYGAGGQLLICQSEAAYLVQVRQHRAQACHNCLCCPALAFLTAEAHAAALDN